MDAERLCIADVRQMRQHLHVFDEALAGFRSAFDPECQNAARAAQNDGYQRDIVALQSGAAAEEDARLNGYARSDEKVYLIAPAPSPTPRPAPRKH